MKSVNRLCVLGLALAVGLTACDDSSTGPGNDGPFNPTTSAADLQVVQEAFDTPVFESLGSMSGNFSRIQDAPVLASVLTDAGWDLVTAGESWQLKEAGERVAGALYSASAAEVVLIPEGYRGRTYDYDPQEGYFFNESRTGAPANGMRFILYDVNPVTHDPEIGYVDLLDESTDLAGVVRVVVVSGDTQFMNYTVSATVLVGSVTFVVDGFISDGTEQIDLDLTAAFSSNFAIPRADINYVISIPSRDFSLNADLSMDFDLEPQSSTTIDVQFQQGAHSVQVLGSFGAIGDGGLQGSASLEVLVDRQLFATITVEGEVLTVVDANGATLSEEHTQALTNMFHAFEGVFDDKFEDFVRPVSWLFQIG